MKLKIDDAAILFPHTSINHLLSNPSQLDPPKEKGMFLWPKSVNPFPRKAK